MTTRRRFVSMLSLTPLAGMGLLSACGEKTPTATPAAAPATPPAPAPVTTPTAPPPAAAAAPPAATPAPAAPVSATALVDPAEQIAGSLGFVSDASKADASKYATYAAGQNCSNCTLYSGLAGETTGPCSIFNGRLVTAQGWCSVWTKRA